MLRVVGTVKVASEERQSHVLHCLNSMEPMAHLIDSWYLNIAGKYRVWARDEILSRWDNVHITIEDTKPPYYLIQDQLIGTDPDSLLFFWQEDHWFVCPHIAMWEYVLRVFQKSSANFLRASHMHTSWWRKGTVLTASVNHLLYREYIVDMEAHEQIWEMDPRASVVGCPGVFKRSLLDVVIECQQDLLKKYLSPIGFEVRFDTAHRFLDNFSYTVMVPEFHVFRHITQRETQRNIGAAIALAWIQLRDGGRKFGGSFNDYN